MKSSRKIQLGDRRRTSSSWRKFTSEQQMNSKPRVYLWFSSVNRIFTIARFKQIIKPNLTRCRPPPGIKCSFSHFTQLNHALLHNPQCLCNLCLWRGRPVKSPSVFFTSLIVPLINLQYAVYKRYDLLPLKTENIQLLVHYMESPFRTNLYNLPCVYKTWFS